MESRLEGDRLLGVLRSEGRRKSCEDFDPIIGDGPEGAHDEGRIDFSNFSLSPKQMV